MVKESIISDAELIWGLAKNPNKYSSYLKDAYTPVLLTYAFGMLDDFTAATEVVNSVFVIFMLNREYREIRADIQDFLLAKTQSATMNRKTMLDKKNK